LRGIRKGFEKGGCPLCSEDEDTVHILLKCSETRKWGGGIFSRKWRIVNEEIAYNKIN
jgi:hypothetical protein